MPPLKNFIALVSLIVLLAGCGSHEKYVQHQADQSSRLRAAFPAGLSRAEVHGRLTSEMSGVEQVPKLSGVRPATGWAVVPQVPGGNWCARTEERTKQIVASFERYSKVDGMYSLCYYWFYFDEGDTLVDAEWQYQSD